MSVRLDASIVARSSYALLVIITAFIAFSSCIFILSQAVRTAPNRNWTRNVNAVVIGGAYILILVVSLAFCLKRRLEVRLRLARIPRERIPLAKGDVPKHVHNFVEEEFLRSCAIAYAARPKVAYRSGWGAPGTKYENIRFRTALLDTVPEVDKTARSVIPSMPPLTHSPRMPLAMHLRHIAQLISADVDGELYFQCYTSAVERARYSESELTEEEFENAMDAGAAVKSILETYRRLLRERGT